VGYTSVANREGAVHAASALLETQIARTGEDEIGDLVARYPLVIEQIAGEAGIVESRVCARAFLQAQGDVARAVSLVRAWAANLPRVGQVVTAPAQWFVLRRITPAYVEPRGGQFLGASRDYEQRLLNFDDRARAAGTTTQTAVAPERSEEETSEAVPTSLPPARGLLDEQGLIAPPASLAQPTDVTRTTASRTQRGAFLQLLARAETGAITSLAYMGIRGHGQRQDPTLLELRVGDVPVRMERPEGGSFVVGSFTATMAELALYAVHESGEADDRFTIGVGITSGRVERRAIAAAMIDAYAARAEGDANFFAAPHEDREYVGIAVDGQEATGFVEHLKLPHHVTFASDLDRVRAAGTQAVRDV